MVMCPPRIWCGVVSRNDVAGCGYMKYGVVVYCIDSLCDVAQHSTVWCGRVWYGAFVVYNVK